LVFKNHPNQTNAVWIGLVGVVYNITLKYQTILTLQEFFIFLTNFSHKFLFLTKRSHFPGKNPRKHLPVKHDFLKPFLKKISSQSVFDRVKSVIQKYFPHKPLVSATFAEL
jgi:hypothetical protein